jgi:hypothetical protein
MRWVKGHPNKLVRWSTAFLWWPKRIGLETRWLERAYWVEQWTPETSWRGLFFTTRAQFLSTLIGRKCR